MNDYLLSICIPTYNRKKLLKRALDSILSQMNDRVELFVSDNASDDGTKEMMEQQYPNVIYLRNDYNIGAEANFLQCCEFAHGKFFILFGSDDVLVEGAMVKILAFLENHPDCALVFMNHVFFEGEYVDISHCTRRWADNFESIATIQKDTLMAYAKERISFMSVLIFSKERYYAIKMPQQYFWTFFFHTNVGFEMVKGDVPVGIIGDCCVADNVTPGDSTVEVEKKNYFEVFGKGLEYSLCTHAVECGFNSKQMKKIYLDYGKSNFPKSIIKIKAFAANNTYKWGDEFKRFVIPILKKYPTLCFYTIPFYIMPSCVARFLCNYFRPIYKMIKRKTF